MSFKVSLHIPDTKFIFKCVVWKYVGENADWEESVMHVYDFPINNFTKQKICFVEVQFIIFFIN